jgi:uncharacterized membrane protein
MDNMPAVRAILGFVLVFVVPGFAWSLVFFRKVNVLERAVLSLGLSVALVTLSVIVLNVLLHIRINGLNALLTIIALTALAMAIYFVRRFAPKSGAPNGD